MWILLPQPVIVISGSLLLIALGFLQADPSSDWVGFILDKAGLAGLAALALYMLRESYSQRLAEKERHKEEMEKLYQDKEALRREHQQEIASLYGELERKSGDFREELTTLHQIVLNALTNNTEVLTEFKTRVEKCPATAYGQQK